MALRKLPDRDLVRQLLDYDPATGVLRWHIRPIERFASLNAATTWNTRFGGTIAGSVTRKGHIEIKIDYQKYLAHRIIWLHVYGEPVPPGMDHIDRNPVNNRITNLRAATQVQNMANKAALTTNKLGVKGVHLSARGNYVAQITAGGKHTFLGRFDTLEEAKEAYRIAAIELHGAFAAPSP